MGSPIDNSSGLLNWPNMPQYGPMMMNNSRIVAGLYALGLVGTGIHSHDKKQKNCQVLPREWTKNPGMCYGFFSFFMVGMVNMLGNGTIHLVKVCCGLHSCYLI